MSIFLKIYCSSYRSCSFLFCVFFLSFFLFFFFKRTSAVCLSHHIDVFAEYRALWRFDDVQGLRASAPARHQEEGGLEDGGQPPHHHAGETATRARIGTAQYSTVRSTLPARNWRLGCTEIRQGIFLFAFLLFTYTAGGCNEASRSWCPTFCGPCF